MAALAGMLVQGSAAVIGDGYKQPERPPLVQHPGKADVEYIGMVDHLGTFGYPLFFLFPVAVMTEGFEVPVVQSQQPAAAARFMAGFVQGAGTAIAADGHASLRI